VFQCVINVGNSTIFMYFYFLWHEVIKIFVSFLFDLAGSSFSGENNSTVQFTGVLNCRNMKNSSMTFTGYLTAKC
jgi:hypothetical protein